jgi:hypothetical protein
MRGLGRLFDFGLDFAPVDLNTAGATGVRFNMSVATGITFVVGLAVAGGGSDDDVMTIQQHTAYTAGTSSTLASASVATSTGITAYWVKSEVSLDNDESWVEVAQAEGGVITLLGATYATKQVLFAVYVGADQLGDTYTHVSLNFADPGSGGSRLGFCIGVLHDLGAQRKPANLPNLLRPGAANV